MILDDSLKVICQKNKLDLQSIGSSPGLHILCARDTIMIPFTTRTWDSFLRLGGTGAYI